jgi:hypothetical protein
MILIVLKYFTPKGFRGITFYPFVFLADKNDKTNPRFVNHEHIHIRQQIEMLVLPFYIWYALEFLIRWAYFKNKKTAYYNISFEREAYQNEKDLNYIQQRPFWGFLKYIS